MKLHRAVIAIAAAAVTVVGGAGCGTQSGNGLAPSTVSDGARQTATAEPSPTTPSEADPSPTAAVTTEPTEPGESSEPTEPSEEQATPEQQKNTSRTGTSSKTGSTSGDQLSEENLIRERLYFDVTGHSFMGDKPGKGRKLGPCTGDKTFASVLPQGAPILSYQMTGDSAGFEVIHQVAQVGSARDARVVADRIIGLVDKCDAIQGGDFGYGDYEPVESNSDRKVVYFPAFDSDKAFGGYIVIQASNRVAVVEVSDSISQQKVAKLAQELGSTTAD